MPLNLPPPKASGSSAPSSSINGSSSSSLSRPGANGSSNGHASPSDNEHAYTEAIATPAIASTSTASSSSSFSSKLGLPPPKTKSKLAAANQPKKFVLDLPKATRSASELEGDDEQTNGSEGPAAKKMRTAGGVGLGALLPEPKKPAAGLGGLKLPEPKSAPVIKESSKPSTSMIPHTLKGKNKATTKPTEVPQVTASTDPASDEEAEQEGEPADSAILDFFGLGPAADDEEEDGEDEATDAATMDFFGLSTTKPAATSSASKLTSTPTLATVKTSFTAAPSSAASTSVISTIKKVSAAPTTAAPDLASNFYATLPVPTKIDPYPGFYQKPDGSWAPKRPDEWEIWSQAQGWGEEAEEEPKKKKKEYKMPADFSAEALKQSVEVRGVNLRGKQVEDLDKPSKFTEEEQQRIEQEKAKAKAKKFSHNARSRHQLTTLVADAQMNRAELEDRISHAKSNKRTGGQKYGF